MSMAALSSCVSRRRMVKAPSLGRMSITVSPRRMRKRCTVTASVAGAQPMESVPSAAKPWEVCTFA